MIAQRESAALLNLDDEWDCVVIGAGPAGTIAARRAAGSGLKTLLVERRQFPRFKVCGACVNQRAISLLAEAGLPDLLESCGAIPLQQFHLRHKGRDLRLNLPGGVAVTRAAFDWALVQAAQAVGATFAHSTSAQVMDRNDVRRGQNRQSSFPDDGVRTIRLQSHDANVSTNTVHEVRAKVVIAADGLGHPSLRGLAEFSETIAPSSRIGLGATVVAGDGLVLPEVIHMAVGREGYVGLVRVETGAVNAAACLDAAFVRETKTPAAAIQRLLQQADFETFDPFATDWTGTPPLTRRINEVAGHRILVVGDAAGYVEPFTGEGIAWALAGGIAAADCASQAIQLGPAASATQWRKEFRQRVAERQKWCRRLAGLLRHPAAVPAAVRVAAAFPWMTQAVLASVNRSVPVSKMAPS